MAKVYEYGAKRPRQEMLPVVMEQLMRANRYYNDLIELYRTRRRKADEARRRLFPDYDEVSSAKEKKEAELKEHQAEVKKRSAKARKRSGTPEDRARSKALRAEIKALKERRKAMLQEMQTNQGYLAEMAQIWDAFGAARRDARAKCEVFWGTYLRIEAAAEQANAAALKGLPSFRRWDGSGQLGVQIQKGMTPQELFLGQDTRLRAEPLPTNRTSPRTARPYLLHVRVGSDGRKPIFAPVMFYLHRQLPEDCLIKDFALVVERIGTLDHWKVQFTIDNAPSPQAAASGMVAIDLGWRLMPDGSLRVASWAGDDGRKGELRIPAKVMSRRGKTRSLQSIRDRNFDKVRAWLGDWLAANKDKVPEWLKEKLSYLGQWRSTRRLAKAILAWKDQRFAVDALPLSDTAYPGLYSAVNEWRHPERTEPEPRPITEIGIYDALELWRQQDVHLWNWQAHNAKKFQRIRKDLYRCFGSQLRKGYRYCVVEDCDWRQLNRLPAPDSDKSEQGEREYQREGAVGMLRSGLGQSGMILVKRPAPDTTRRCHLCGSLEEFDQAAELVHTCSGCSAVWDQDENAAQNLLKAGKEGPLPEDPADRPKKPSRWAKRKKKDEETTTPEQPPADDQAAGAA